MDEKIYKSVWVRDDSTCQKCRKHFIKEESVNYTEEAKSQLKKIEKIPLYRWDDTCWKCKKITPFVTYDISIQNSCLLGDIPTIDAEISKLYNFVKYKYSRTMNSSYYTNTCSHCGVIQGKFFLLNRFIEAIYEHGKDKLIDSFIVNSLNVEDLNLEIKGIHKHLKRNSEIAHIHHLDKNRKNNNMNNLLLLCFECHLKEHNKTIKNAKYKRKKTISDQINFL